MGYESDLCCLVGSFDQPWMNTALQLVLEGIRVGTVLPGSPLVREEATKICARVSKLGNIFFRLRKVDCPSDCNKALEDVGCALPGLDHLVVPQVPLVLALLHGRPQPAWVEGGLGGEQVPEVPEGQPGGPVLAGHSQHPQVLCCGHWGNPPFRGGKRYFQATTPWHKSWWPLLLPMGNQATQIRLLSPQASVEELCSSKADQSSRPGGMECPQVALGGQGAAA